MADTGLVVGGIVLLAIGLAGFVAGIFFYGVVKEEPRPVYVNLPAPMYAPPPTYCPQCGSPLQWVPQYGRGYCPQCGAYR